MVILISDKVHFRAKKVTRDNESHFYHDKGVIHLEDITIPNGYVSKNRTSNYK